MSLENTRKALADALLFIVSKFPDTIDDKTAWTASRKGDGYECEFNLGVKKIFFFIQFVYENGEFVARGFSRDENGNEASKPVQYKYGAFRLPLEDVRATIAEQQFMHYDFGDDIYVTDTSGWEHSSGSDEWSRKVYVEMDGDADSQAITFVVRFTSKSSTVSEVYARDNKGSDIGSLQIFV